MSRLSHRLRLPSGLLTARLWFSLWIALGAGPCVAQVVGATGADAGSEPPGISISTRGGLPGILSGDLRLQWVVPDDEQATRILRDMAYVVEEAESSRGLRRTLTSRGTFGGRRLVHHYYLSVAGSAGESISARQTLRMELDLPAGATIELAGRPSFIPEPLPGFGAAYGSVRAVVVNADGQRTIERDEDSADPIEQTLGPADWFGVRNRFWTGLFRSESDSLSVDFDVATENQPRLFMRSPNGDARLRLELYAGPLDPARLRAVDPALSGMLFAVLWDWLRAICFGMLWLLTWLDGLVGQIGLAIVLLSLCVKILMSPLTVIADRWQDAVNQTAALLQPQIDAIKREYKGEEAHERILAVYKENDVHPMYTIKSLAGFLIQIPIFIAAFDMLGENFALNGASFLWIEDLAKPDRWLSLPWTLPFFGGHLNLLPCLMTGVTVLTSWIQTDPSLTPELLHKQRVRLYLMAGAFFVLFYTFPAGMVLYWTTNNVLHLLKIQLARLIPGLRT